MCFLEDWIWTPASFLFRQCSQAWGVILSKLCAFAERHRSQNGLSTSIVTAPSVNSFKRQLDSAWEELFAEVAWFLIPDPNCAIPFYNISVYAIPTPNSLSIIIGPTLKLLCIVLPYLYVIIEVLYGPLYHYYYYYYKDDLKKSIKSKFIALWKELCDRVPNVELGRQFHQLAQARSRANDFEHALIPSRVINHCLQDITWWL